MGIWTDIPEPKYTRFYKATEKAKEKERAAQAQRDASNQWLPNAGTTAQKKAKTAQKKQTGSAFSSKQKGSASSSKTEGSAKPLYTGSVFERVNSQNPFRKTRGNTTQKTANKQATAAKGP